MATLSESLQGIIPGTLLAYVTTLSLVFISVLLYRITLHPLAKFPGPVFARVTDLVDIYRTTIGNRHCTQYANHKEYGSIVRIGPNTLSFNTIEAVTKIYTSRQANVRKAPWYTVIEPSGGGANSIHAETDRHVHASHRRVMEHAFTDKALRASQAYLVDNVHNFEDAILRQGKHEEGWSQPLNMSQWATYLNYDIMGDLVFGRKFDLMTSEAHRFVPKLLMNSTAFIYTFASLPFKAVLRHLLRSGILGMPIIGGSMARDDQKFYEYAENVLGERILAKDEEAATRKDIMHHLLHATDPTTGQGFSREQLNVESSLLIAAGADTTSLTLAAAFFYLLRNPRTMQILLEEVQSVFVSEDLKPITPSKLMGMPYLRAVIDETLRLSPPVPSLLPREVLSGGMVIDGNFIAEGTIVGVSAYAIHRNPEYFPEPDAFCPERWIVCTRDSDDSPSESLSSIPRTSHSVSLARQAFISFSQGSRGCIGRQLAYYELHTALAFLLHRFDVRLARDAMTQKLTEDTTAWREGFAGDVAGRTKAKESQRKDDEFQLIDRFLSDRNGPMVQFRERVQ